VGCHLSIWLVPDKNDKSYLENVINDLSVEHNGPVFLPHCTLYSYTDMPESKLKKILEYISTYSSPISVNTYRLHFSSNIWKSVYIELEKSKELMELQQDLVYQLCSSKKYHFSPHISLLYSDINSKKKKKIVEKLSLKNTFKMDRICAVETGLNVVNWKNIIEKIFYA